MMMRVACFLRGWFGPLSCPTVVDDHPIGSRVIRLMFLVVITVLAAAHQAYAQGHGGQQANLAQGRNVLLAGAIELVVPLVGHAYAGDLGRGLWPAAVTVGGFAAMEFAFFAIDDNCRIGEDGVQVCDNASRLVLMCGALSYLAGRVWGAVSAVNTARQANTLLIRQQTGRNDAEVDLSVSQVGQITIGMAVRF